MIEYAFQTDQIYSASYGVRVIDSYPVIEYGAPVYTQTSIPGRKGTLTEFDGTYTDTVVTMDCDITLIDDLSVDLQFQKFVSQLSKSKTLTIEGMETSFFRIKKVEVSGYGRYSDISIEFQLTFTCEPGLYQIDGDRYVSVLHEHIFNANSLSEPVYRINGSGRCVLSVNDKTMNLDLNGLVYIDTARQEVLLASGALANTLADGDYEDLFLQPGLNRITVSSGFDLKIKPRWRWMHP